MATAVNSLDDSNISAAAGIQASKLATGATGLAQGAFSAYRNAAGSLGTGAVVPFDAEEFDISSWFDVTTNIGRFTPLVAGYYRLDWSISSNVILTADVFWMASIRKNGTRAKQGQPVYQRGATVAAASVGTAIVQANGSTDYFDVMLEHGTGGAAALAVGAAFTFFQGELIGRS